MIRNLLIFLLLILVSCVAKKKAAEFEAQPGWMKVKPVESAYYIGVGSAKKVGTVQEYTENSKRDALTDLAEEISINVSSTSVLHTIETESGFDETFDRTIQITTDDYLEGFEPVDFYENENSYWVYYRISKTLYIEKKELRKQQAINIAKEKYLAGKKEEEQHHAKEAITFYLQGLQSIYKYLGEETLKEVNGKTIDLGNELYTSLNTVISDLKIVAINDHVSVERGKALDSPLMFKTCYKSTMENGLPVIFKYTGGYLKQDHGFSNEIGLVGVQSWNIQSRNPYEKVTAAINLKQIAQKAVENLFIRGILIKQTIEPAVTVINILKPNILLTIPVHYCKNDPCEKIQKAFNQIALSEGFNISDQNSTAYTFGVKFTSTKGERAGGLFASYISGEITLRNKENEKIWSKSVDEIKGVGRNENEAHKKAFDEFVADLNHIHFPEVFDQIK